MLQNLKLLLGLDGSDTSLDAKLSLLLTMTTARLKLLLGGIEPPESMEHIITEVSVIRFNRIGSEGVASHSVEGESLQFTDGDFDGFADEIQAFLDSQTVSSRGRVKFL